MDENIDTAPEQIEPEDDAWLDMARDAHTQSTDWFDASLRKNVEKAMAHFNNRHAPGSKYHSESYKFRSKGFRPKTRASVRRNEAAASVAFFSTQDMVHIAAENEADEGQKVSASILTELVNYRLDDSIPWFRTLVGAYQDTLNTGVVISHQSWDYDEEAAEMPVLDEMGTPAVDEVTGQPVTQTMRQVLTDKPRIDLVAIENFRISPASDWADPIGSSPYIIEMIPMFIGDVQAKMVAGKWIEYDQGEIQTAAQSQYDSVRAARDGTKRADATDVTYATSAFDTVWVHRNIIRKDGEDWIFYTLGTHLRLSDPKPLREEYRHLARGERPYVMGNCIIETHKAYAVGLNELTFGLQEECNEINNQRRDNVSLVMNKRYFARRTANVDYKSLTRNVPGSITLVDDINQDIRWDSPPDVTGSSYQEQDRVSLDYDELAGTFSPGSVQSNNAVNNTLGGMKLLSGDANVITEYQLRVFAETWAEPVLKQLVKLEQAYETDAKVLAIAGQRSKLFQKMGVEQVTDDLLQGMVTVRVNVGFGATNPQQRVEKLVMGLNAIAPFAPMVMQKLDAKEVVTEIFGALGYKGAERFFPGLDQEENPQMAQMQQQIQQLQQQLQGKQMEIDGRIKTAEIAAQARVQVEQLQAKEEADHAVAQAHLELNRQLFEAQQNALDRKGDLDKIKAELAQTAAKLRLQQQLSAGTRGQVLIPAAEPAQRAPDGQAFAQ